MRGALLSKNIQLIYRFDTVTGNFNLSFSVDKEIIIFYVYKDGQGSKVKEPSDDDIKSITKSYNIGGPKNELIAYTSSLDAERRGIYDVLRQKENVTNIYDLYFKAYDDVIVCVIKSRNPWHYQINFDEDIVSLVIRRYNVQENVYVTIGNISRQNKTDVVCRIISPDGLIAIQKIHISESASATESFMIGTGPIVGFLVVIVVACVAAISFMYRIRTRLFGIIFRKTIVRPV